MNIWLINNYVTLPQHGHFCRQYYFGKNLKDMGHAPVVFAGSHPHNSDVQLIEGPEKFQVLQEEPFPWVLVKTAKYGKSRKKQILTMFQFYRNGKKAAKRAVERYGKPDAVLGSSAHPLAALLAVRLGKRFGCRSIVEVRDLWQESIVAFGVAGPHNPAVIALRRLEKWLYTHADAVVFTIEGAYDYIVEQGWDKEIPRTKVFFVNNGVDLKAFDHDREYFQLEDPDLENPETFKVIYTGSIRLANGLDQLVECAARLREHSDIRFLVYGTGSDLERLQEQVRREGLDNLVFKGHVEKRYIPYILSKSDLNVLNYLPDVTKLYRFGSSQNKLFEYLASGKPVLSNAKISYSIIDRGHCGVSLEESSPDALAQAVLKLYEMSPEEYRKLCQNARHAAEDYDYPRLTQKLLDVIKGDEGS